MAKARILRLALTSFGIMFAFLVADVRRRFGLGHRLGDATVTYARQRCQACVLDFKVFLLLRQVCYLCIDLLGFVVVTCRLCRLGQVYQTKHSNHKRDKHGMGNWAEFDIGREPGAVLITGESRTAPSILPLIVGGGIRHVVVFLFVFRVKGWSPGPLVAARTPPKLLVKPDGDFFFDRLALYWNVDRHFFAPSLFLFYFFTATRRRALRDRGL